MRNNALHSFILIGVRFKLNEERKWVSLLITIKRI